MTREWVRTLTGCVCGMGLAIAIWIPIVEATDMPPGPNFLGAVALGGGLSLAGIAWATR